MCTNKVRNFEKLIKISTYAVVLENNKLKLLLDSIFIFITDIDNTS
jgi:hypothetical protein